MLARRATWLRRCVGPNAFGNALGDSLAAANGQSSGRYASDDPLGGLIALNGGWSGVSADLPQRVGSFSPDMSVSTADQLLADLGSGGRSYGGGNLYADASRVLRAGVMTDAGGGGINPESVESLRKPDGTYRTEIRGVADNSLTDADVASMRAENLSRAQSLAAQSTTSSDGGSSMWVDGDGVPHILVSGTSADIKNAAEVAAFGGRSTITDPAAYSPVDQMGQPLDGPSTYNAFDQIGKVWSGNDSLGSKLGKTWDWATYTTPDAPQLRQAYMDRINAESERWATIDAVRGSGLAGIAVAGGYAAGASPETLARLAQTGAALEGLAGAGTGIYKQTLTAQAPSPYGAATRPRGLVPPQGGGSTGAPVLFENKYPEHGINMAKIVPTNRLGGISGNFNYVVREDGSLVVGRSGHTSLTGGVPVQAAGELQLYNGNIKWIDNA